MKHLVTLFFLIPGIINVLPVVGILSNERLQQLYGIDPLNNDLALLMRHRAVLFAIVGGLLIAAAWQPMLRTPAFVAGMVSMLSYLVLMGLIEINNPALVRIAWVDVVGCILLAAGYIVHKAQT